MSRLALANCRDLLPLIDWNRRHGIHFFRIPSALFPWDSEYELEQLPGGWRAGEVPGWQGGRGGLVMAGDGWCWCVCQLLCSGAPYSLHAWFGIWSCAGSIRELSA